MAPAGERRDELETTERVRKVRVSAMLVLGVAALGAGLMALTWSKAQPAEATTDPGKIVFVSDRNAVSSNPFDIYIMNPDGSGVSRVAERPGAEDSPILSPDGKKIAFCSCNGQDFAIHVMNVDGTGEVNVSSGVSQFNASPTWSPDGSKVAYTGVNPGEISASRQWDIFTANAGQPHQLLLEQRV